MQNARLDETQAGIKMARRTINNSDMQMTPPLWQKAKGAKEPLDESEKVGLKLTIKLVKLRSWHLKLVKLRSWHLVLSLHGKQMGKQWKP